MSFDYDQNFRKLNFRESPELYQVGKGEQGVLLVEPYKSELLPYWKFRTPKEAEKSAKKIFRQFQIYKKEDDFIGMDMARKFLQMGYTRSRRYANHRSGKKYDGPVPDDKKGQSGAHGREVLPHENDPIKAKSAEIFFKYWKRTENDSRYREMKSQWREWFG
jgi:hypothetical protein